MTSRRACKRMGVRPDRDATQSRPTGAASAAGGGLTDDELTALRDMPVMPGGEMQLATMPGCDKSSHRQFIASLSMAAVAIGYANESYERMPCGCALRVMAGRCEFRWA